jgi:hypothetical protein
MEGRWLARRCLSVLVRGAIVLAVAFAVFPASAGALVPLPIHPTRTDDPSSEGTSCSSMAGLDTDCSLRNALVDATVNGEGVSLGSPSPAGPYTVTQSTPLTISHNINLVGVGARSSTIVRTGGFPAGVLQITSGVAVGATVRGVTITGGGAANGGGIDNEGVLTVRETTVTGNQATGEGGGINNSQTLTVIGSTIEGNTANSGGGINTDGLSASVVLVNSTVADNTTVGGGIGGGIFNTFGTVTLASDTLSSNHAPAGGLGGNIYNKDMVLARNTIITGGTATSGEENCGAGGGVPVVSQGYNLEDRDQCGLDNTGDQVNTDPLLGALQNNGGPTDTQALPLGSPAVDQGNPAGCTDASAALLMVDQRGMARPQGLNCDIGAYELQPVTPGATVAPVSGVGPSGATLHGAVDTHNFPTSWQFEYGPTTAYGSSTLSQMLVSGTQPVSAIIVGLLPGTTYHFALSASTTGGTIETADQIFTTAPSSGGSPGSGQPSGLGAGGTEPPGPGGRVTQPPVLGPIAIVPSAFRAASSGASIVTVHRIGATVSYSDSQRSTTGFTIFQVRPGTSLRGRCVPPPEHPLHPRERACTRYIAAGGFTHIDASGPNRFRFTGRVHGHKLPPGNYLLDATPTANGRTGSTVAAHFRILG